MFAHKPNASFLPVLGAAVCASLAMVSVAHARSQPASLGRAVKAAEIPCFQMVSSGMKHVGCPGETTTPHRSFELPLVIEDAARHWIKVFQTTPHGGPQTSCRAIGMRNDGVFFSGSEWGDSSGATPIVLRNVGVPSEGYAFANCQVPKDAVIWNVVFSRE